MTKPKRWTRCSCGHIAQDHNRALSGDRWGCDAGHLDGCKTTGCHPKPCACENYDGHEVSAITNVPTGAQ